MRGWTQNQLIPQDAIDAGDFSLGQGGEFYLNLVADLRIPTGWCPFAGICLEVGAFADLGNVWRKPPPVSEWWRLRFSPGAGVRATTPVGILAFDVGFVPFYNRAAGENWVQTVQFYLGNTL
jgi:outer membrane protein assembly factor BamA